MIGTPAVKGQEQDKEQLKRGGHVSPCPKKFPSLGVASVKLARTLKVHNGSG